MANNDNWRDFLKDVHKQNEEAIMNTIIRNAQKDSDNQCDGDSCRIK